MGHRYCQGKVRLELEMVKGKVKKRARARLGEGWETKKWGLALMAEKSC